mgnify:CR=1
MKIDNEFEIIAKLHGLSVNKNDHNYLDPKTELAWIFWFAQQVKINKLEHDLKNEQCASRILSDIVKMYEAKEVVV